MRKPRCLLNGMPVYDSEYLTGYMSAISDVINLLRYKDERLRNKYCGGLKPIAIADLIKMNTLQEIEQTLNDFRNDE